MNKNVSILCAGLVAALLAGCVSPIPEADVSFAGEKLFNGYVHDNVECFACHAGDGSGTWMGSNLIGIGERKSREEISDAIRKGPGMMPDYEGKLTDDELDEIVDWLISLK